MTNDVNPNIREHGSGLSAKGLIDAAPQQHGVVLKLHIPFLFNILPEFIQRFILSLSFLSFMAPSWKKRYLILCGSYLYKFKDQAASLPKGKPFEMEAIDFDLVRAGQSMNELGVLPPGFTAVFFVSTLGRRHYYAVADREEALVWVRTLHDARQATITHSMRHDTNMPYPPAWKYFDSLGRSLVKSKDRIRARMEEARLREMEMTNFAEAGPLPRGYHA